MICQQVETEKIKRKNHNNGLIRLNASRKKEVAEYLKKLEEGQPSSHHLLKAPYNQNEMKNPYRTK